MIDGICTVLLAGLDDVLARRVVVALGPLGAQFHRTPVESMLEDPERAVGSDVIVVHYAGDRQTLARQARLGGGWTSSTRPGALLVLCGSEWFEEVSPFVGCGVSRVVLLEESDRRLRAAVSSLLEVAPRFRIRAPVRLLATDGGEEGETIGSTENISVTGMLVSGPLDFAVGSMVEFEIPLARGKHPIRGAMEIVRVTNPEWEGVRGVGARFLHISPSDFELMEWLVAGQLE